MGKIILLRQRRMGVGAMTALGQFLQGLRERRGISIREVSRRSGIAPSFLSRMERGIEINPGIKVLALLSSSLNVSLARLATLAADPHLPKRRSARKPATRNRGT